jgi:hypothetical protein
MQSLKEISNEELLAKYRLAERQRVKLEDDARIEYFGVVDKDLAERHKDCCKLGKGPNRLQARLIDAWQNPRYKVFVYTGANKIGKTTIGSILCASAMRGYLPWDKEIKASNPPIRIRYVGQDWENHIKAVVIPVFKMWWNKDWKVHTSKNNQGAESNWEDLETGSTLEIMSNKQDVDVFEGWDGDLVIYDEPPKREIRIACARGLAVNNGRELFTATLLKEPWLHKDVINAKLDDGTPDPTVFSVSGDIYENLGFGLNQDGIDEFSKKLTPEEKEARIHGIPSYMQGLVYPQFDRSMHVKKDFQIPLDWIIDIAIDFHPSKAWAVLFLATAGDNRKYIFDEIWEHGSWLNIGEEIIRRCSRNNYRVENIIIDPLAKGGAQSDLDELSVYDKMSDLFAGYGYSLMGASKDKEGGIQLTKDLLLTQNMETALFFTRNCRRAIEEIEGWMYDEHGKPIKKDDDMMENLYRMILLDTQWYPRVKKTSSSVVSWSVV